jgi:hypothetical protein
MKAVTFWQDEFGTIPVPERFAGVKMRAHDPSWPDLRFTLGREMVAHFTAETDKRRAAFIAGK